MKVKIVFLVLIIVLVVAVVYLKLAISESIENGKSKYAVNNISLALRSYKEIYGTLPPSYTTNEDGSFELNWKVLTLPFTDYNEIFLKIIERKIVNKEHGIEIPNQYYQIHRAYGKNMADDSLTNDFVLPLAGINNNIFLYKNQEINCVLFLEDKKNDFFKNGIIEKINSNEQYNKLKIKQVINQNLSVDESVCKEGGGDIDVKIIENNGKRIISENKDEDLIVGFLLLAGELNQVNDKSNIYKAIEKIDEGYSKLVVEVKNKIVKKIKMRGANPIS